MRNTVRTLAFGICAVGVLASLADPASATAVADVAGASQSPTTRASGDSGTAPSRTMSNRAFANDAGLSSPVTFNEFASGTSITDQYRDRGLVFGGDAPFVTGDGANPTSPVLSGTPMFQGSIEVTIVDPDTGQPTVSDGFALDVGYIDSPNSVEVVSYGIDGSQLAAARANAMGIDTIDVAMRGIARFRVAAVSDEPAGFAIDNVRLRSGAVGIKPQKMASLGDSYSSGEGLLEAPNDSGAPLTYDCGTNLHKGTYTENTTVRYRGVWAWGWDCDIPTRSRSAPLDFASRAPVQYANMCHRTGKAYPNQIRESLGISASNSLFVACSGAVTRNIGFGSDAGAQYANTSPHRVAGGNTQSYDLWNFAQQGAAAPDFITLGIGGNDAGFAKIIEKCLFSDCLNTPGFQSGVMATIDQRVYPRLIETLSELRSTYDDATAAVFGYPTVLANDRSCGEIHSKGGLWDIGPEERRWTNEVLLPKLNNAIADAAGIAGVTYIDITDVTKGHEICTADPWMNGIKTGDDTGPLNLIGNESFHPNQKAHQAIAAFFVSHYTDGNGQLLFSNPTARPIIPHPATPPALVVGSVNDAALSTPCGQSCVTPNVCGASCLLHISGNGFGPTMNLHVAAYSDPVDLGNITTDARGDFEADIAVPNGALPAGYHHLELTGTDDDGTAYEGYAPFTVVDEFSISAVSAVVTGKTTAQVSWNSARPAMGQVEVTGGGAAPRTFSRNELSGAHSVDLSGLVAGQTYRLTVSSVTTSGNAASQQLDLAIPSRASGPNPGAKINVTAVNGKSKLKVDIDPDLRAGSWAFRVQSKKDHRWAALKRLFRSMGSRETSTINLPRGKYRIVLLAPDGRAISTSRVVGLVR